jgi:hypothetical protein
MQAVANVLNGSVYFVGDPRRKLPYRTKLLGHPELSFQTLTLFELTLELSIAFKEFLGRQVQRAFELLSIFISLTIGFVHGA